MFNVRCSMFVLLIRVHPFQKSNHRVPMLQHFRFLPDFGKGQSITLGMAQNQQAVFADDTGQMFIVQQLLRKGSGPPVHIFFAVGRIGQHHIKSLIRR